MPKKRDVKQPNYLHPERRSPVGKMNDQAYERNRLEWQLALDRHPLADSFQTLQDQQMDAGFICDDLTEVRYFQCYGIGGECFFIGQFNPRRAVRSVGAGRTTPPSGIETISTPTTKCFLCVDNVRWQSRGIQLYYQFEIGDQKNLYNALCNPFPFMPTHMTIASAEHEPQSWHKTIAWDKNEDKVVRIVSDLYDIAVQLQGYVSFYNGVGAGASIEEHFHFQAFKIPSGHGQFPLQRVAGIVENKTKAASMLTDNDISTIIIDSHDYPLTAFRIRGTRDTTIQAVVERIKKWNSVVEDSASANITAIWEGGELVMYLIPRNRFYSRSIGMAGIVGGLEVLGEFIFCTPEENSSINTQKITFDYMWMILMGVKPPNIERLSIRS